MLHFYYAHNAPPQAYWCKTTYFNLDFWNCLAGPPTSGGKTLSSDSWGCAEQQLTKQDAEASKCSIRSLSSAKYRPVLLDHLVGLYAALIRPEDLCLSEWRSVLFCLIFLTPWWHDKLYSLILQRIKYMTSESRIEI